MYLSSDEEKILEGEAGEGERLAMKLLVDLGEFFEADKLIPIDSAHISGVSYLTGGDGLIDQLKLFVASKAKVKVFSTLNPGGMDRKNWKDQFIDLEFATKQFSILQYFQELDVSVTASCTPYDFGHILTKGQHVAWAESSAVAFANSYFGARTNKEDSLSVLAAAITGKTPNYGFHQTANRKPNVLVNVDADVKEYSDYSMLGEVVGVAFKKHSFQFGAIPLFKGIDKPRPQELKALGASLASFGTQLYHVNGWTPEKELHTVDGVQDEITVTQEMIEETYAQFVPPDDVKITVIGCPNANLEEIIELTKLVKGKKLMEDKEFWLFTNAAQKALAVSSGYTKILNEAGVKIFVDTCPEVTPYDKERFDKILTNSVKAQHYISAPSLNGLPTYVLPVHKCVEMMFEGEEEDE